jgi:Pregnancy-associated plasma protein-A/Secretion system C-terminal sorting domain
MFVMFFIFTPLRKNSMMKTIFISFYIFCFAIYGANAQRRCASYEHNKALIENDAEFAQKRMTIETQTEIFRLQPQKKSRTIVTVPVVVHIIYNTTAQNISDAQITSQITALNQDFRKLNQDFSGTPAVFQPLGADCEIEFCLAQQNPAGVATNGIVRVQTSNVSFTDNDDVKFNSTGGDNSWDATKYLNIWVCPLSGGLLGYAQLPGGSASTDGVVVKTTAFGVGGSSIAPYNKGRTATHEVGHWLNLLHIWGEDNGSCLGSDLVNDTPNQDADNIGCPTFPQISCGNSPNGELFMNFMDYTNDACMFMFTNGQSTRMNALFAMGGVRHSIVNSIGCIAPNVGICVTPSLLNANPVGATMATLNWASVAGATLYNIQYKLNSSSIWTTTTSTTNTKAINGLNVSTSYDFKVQAICGISTGVYSGIMSFTTTPFNGICIDNYEPNNTRTTAVAIPINNNLTSILANNTDKDFFKISTTNTNPKLKVSLTNLPADYDLKLYNTGGTQLGASLKRGISTESIVYNAANTGQTYIIMVSGYNGAFNNTNCYNLITQTSASNLRLEDITIAYDIEMNMYPNPCKDKLNVQFNPSILGTYCISVYSTLGQKLITTSGQTDLNNNPISVAVHDLSVGHYLLELTINNEKYIKQFSVVR